MGRGNPACSTRNLPESLSGIETDDRLGEDLNQPPEIYPNPFQGLKPTER